MRSVSQLTVAILQHYPWSYDPYALPKSISCQFQNLFKEISLYLVFVLRTFQRNCSSDEEEILNRSDGRGAASGEETDGEMIISSQPGTLAANGK